MNVPVRTVWTEGQVCIPLALVEGVLIPGKFVQAAVQTRTVTVQAEGSLPGGFPGAQMQFMQDEEHGQEGI